MALFINKTNYANELVESSQGRVGTPDGNVFFDMANDTIELIGGDELANLVITDTAHPRYTNGTDSVTNHLDNFLGLDLRALYNFENERRENNENLREFLRGSKGTYRFAGAFDFVNGVKLAADVLGDGSTDRNKIRGSGWIEFADTQDGKTDVDRIYHGNLSLVDVQATTQPRYALVADTLEATLQAATWNDYSRVGDINEAVQVFGSTAFGDATAGSFDDTASILVVRVRSWQYNPGETTSVATNISEFSGFSAGYGVGESLNPANTYNLADVFGGGQISPWTGMSLVKAAATDKQSENFNEAGVANFVWILTNSAGGTAQECAAFLDALTLQAVSVDDGAGTYDGQKGRVWYNRDAAGLIVTVSAESEGLFIDGLSTAEKQNVIMTDDTDTTRTYPFFPDVQIAVGAAAKADAKAWYHVFYDEGTGVFDTATAFTVLDSVGAPVKGLCSTADGANIISFAYAYDTNTENGAGAGDKDIVVVVEGNASGGVGVEQAITYATIKRDAIVPITCSPGVDNNA